MRRRRCTSKLLLTARCAAPASLCCVCWCGSSAASSSAVQLEQPQASTRARAEEEEHRQESCTRCRVQLLCGILPSPCFSERKMTILTPPLAKFSPAARTKAPPPPAGRRCAAKIGYPNRHHHSCMVSTRRRCPGPRFLTCFRFFRIAFARCLPSAHFLDRPLAVVLYNQCM